MSSGVPTSTFNASEPIPGYRLIERIGAGGYGEVWRAEAPGGIAKAVKIVHGYGDDERAVRELGALNHIKEVRHPFLLSLDRIELIDNYLVIVTELASSSLKEVFEQHQRTGLPGIPREELLTHLRDVADALDYICREHSLQHLDVKPENLLLVGGRVKVADFGLVKDLASASCTMTGGLTPVYAAPELFEGRPNNHCDQYSLAIVYQEMLTGSLPFEGRTTAQLASQHLHSRPRLDRLPASDQPTIARALAKDPAQRFPGSSDMIESLWEATPNYRPRSSRAGMRASAYFVPPPSEMSKTDVLYRPELETSNLGDAVIPAAAAMRVAEPAPAIRDLPPLSLEPGEIGHRPTIFVGLGGLAARTLQALRRRLVARFGDIHAVPALQMLLFDTDAETLKQVTEGDELTALSNETALLLPLRQPAEYRRQSGGQLQWLNRRWLFNIPRSMQTQGFRPLGRLAMVDHIDRVVSGLARVIKSATDEQGLAASAQQTGLSFTQQSPRVFIISSISGGAGSGMAIDMAYITRQILRDLGIEEEQVYGVLAHCTGRNPQSRDLAVANSYAFLSELHHYSEFQHAYPGDRSCGIPAFPAEEPPFNHAYVLHLGEELENEDFTRATEQIAEYLYRDAVTPAGSFAEQCRALQETNAPSLSAVPTVRSFGLCQLGFSYRDVPQAAVDELCQSLLARWRGADKPVHEESQGTLSDTNSLLAAKIATGLSSSQVRAGVIACTKALGLEVRPVIAQLHTLAIQDIGSDLDSYLLRLLEELAKNQATAQGFLTRLPPNQLVVDTLDRILCSQGAADAREISLESVLNSHVAEMANHQAAALRDWIQGLLRSPKYRVLGAQQAVDCLVQELREISRQAAESLPTLHADASQLEATLRSEKASCLKFKGIGSRRLVIEPRLIQYFHLKVDTLILNGVCRLVGLVQAQLATLDDKLRNLARDLLRLTEEFQRPSKSSGGGAAPTPTDGAETATRLVAETIAAHKTRLLEELERDLEEELTRASSLEKDSAPAVLAKVLRRATKAKILHALQEVAVRKIAADGDVQSSDPIFSLTASLQAAMPRLLDCGGARRLLVVVPGGAFPARLVKQLGDQVAEAPTVIANADNEVLFCYEAEQLVLRRVAAAVLAGRDQNVQLASRLYTRTDVPWSQL